MMEPVIGPGDAPELSRPLPVERLGGAAYETRIVANPAERAALAKRFGILALERLEAQVRARATGPGARVRVEGHVDAVVVQACVVSLDPVRSELGDDFVQLYSLNPEDAPAKDVSVTPGAEEDEPEPLGPGGLDLGEAVAQQLALMLDPYPRSPGAELAEIEHQDSDGAAREGRRPFAALEALKRR